jgi:hypothetical protein
VKPLLSILLLGLGCSAPPERTSQPTTPCHVCGGWKVTSTMEFRPANDYRPDRWLCDRCATP